MRVGISFPMHEFGTDPGAIRDFARTAEDLGYTHITALDHVLGPVHADRVPALAGPYTERDHFQEPLMLFAYFAGATRTIGFLSTIIILPQRQTALVAKQAAQLAIMAGTGRFRLGVGIGWNHVEYEALEVPYRERGARLEEQVEVLRRLWSDDLVDYQGRFHRIDRASMLPHPPGPIPIWFGGFSDAAMDRAGRIGDGFDFSRLTSLSVAGIAKIKAAASAAGRDPRVLGFEVNLPFAAGPDAWARDLERWEAAGGTHACLQTGGAGLATPAAHLDAMRRYAEAMGLHRPR